MSNAIAIDLIHPNPYQPRQGEDMQAVLELAENIEKNATEDFDGLLQVPTVRKTGAGYELAFGHTRLAAFKYLSEQGKNYGMMRVEERDLTDLQMFELAVSENMKRRDLNPIEQAEALRRYMDEFGKTSVEAGEFFGISAATIRGTVRLLNLPEAAQEKVRSGEIKTNEARALLVVEKLMGEEGVEDVLDRIGEQEGIIESIHTVLRFHSGAVHLDLEDGWMKASPFPVKHLSALKKKDIYNILLEDVEDGSELEGKESEIERLSSLVQAGMVVTDESFPMFSADSLEKVRVVMNPPGCEQCPLHARLDGDHYCGFKVCANRKEGAWKEQEAETISQALGMPLYKKEDGQYVGLSQYDAADKKLVAEVHADLRLMSISGKTYNNFEGVGLWTKVVAVGDLAKKRMKKQEKAAEQKPQPEQRDWELERKLAGTAREFCCRFNWEVASKIFAPALDGVTSLELLLKLEDEFNADFPEEVDYAEIVAGIKKAKKPEGLKQARRLVMIGLLDRSVPMNSDEKKPVVVYSKQFVQVAETWGVKLPKDWAVQAEKYQAELAATQKDMREARAKEKAK